MNLFDINDDFFDWLARETKEIDEIMEDLYNKELYTDASLNNIKTIIDEELNERT
jgi:hypothetical protein